MVLSNTGQTLGFGFNKENYCKRLRRAPHWLAELGRFVLSVASCFYCRLVLKSWTGSPDLLLEVGL